MINRYVLNESSQPKAESPLEFAKIFENNFKNISPYMSKDLVTAAGFNVETPIVTALIGNLTGTLPTKKPESETLKCEICDCELTSSVVLKLHLSGSRHKKKLKALEIIEQLRKQNNKKLRLGDSDNPNTFRCEICFLTVNSAQQLEFHLSGAKHKKKAAADAAGSEDKIILDKSSKDIKNTGKTQDTGPPAGKKKKKYEPKIIHCDLCNIFVNSQIQYDQHLVSRKHLSKTVKKKVRRKSRSEKFTKFPWLCRVQNVPQ